MKLTAQITGLKYTPTLGRKLGKFPIAFLRQALSSDAAFSIEMGEGKNFAVSWWVSSKRTRSYPYARVYDTLGFPGKRVTIIPVFKDEGRDGDRDFLQWDTISLMSLLGVYVIVGYYTSATRNKAYKNKITDQRFDADYLTGQLRALLSYQSDALHWNISQINKVGDLAKKALSAYGEISKQERVEMHSVKSADRRISQLTKGKQQFMLLSRKLAQSAQIREITTVQPKEKLTGVKATILISNYLGGLYYFTIDEVRNIGRDVLLIEGKHTKNDRLPSLDDIKDALLKMILYTNLQNVKLDSQDVSFVPTLLLTTGKGVTSEQLVSDKTFLQLKKEANLNRFQILLNNMPVRG
jgi:hypothetical protein